MDFSKAQVMTFLTEQGIAIAKELEVTMMQEVIWLGCEYQFLVRIVINCYVGLIFSHVNCLIFTARQ